LLAENHPEDIFDENILGAATDEDLLATLRIAMHCTNGVPRARPTMQHVVKMLQKVSGEDDVICRSRPSSMGKALALTQAQTSTKAASVETGMVYPCDDAV
jgi:hypothetical protein